MGLISPQLNNHGQNLLNCSRHGTYGMPTALYLAKQPYPRVLAWC